MRISDWSSDVCSSDLERPPMDWHIGGFVSARMKMTPDRAFNELTEDERPEIFNLGIVRLLAEVQEATGPQRLPHLAGWCAGLLQPVVDRFRNRTRREEMASALRQLAVHGHLSALVGMIDNPDRRLADEVGFRRARREFAAPAEPMRWLRNGGPPNPALVSAAPRQTAPTIR